MAFFFLSIFKGPPNFIECAYSKLWVIIEKNTIFQLKYPLSIHCFIILWNKGFPIRFKGNNFTASIWYVLPTYIRIGYAMTMALHMSDVKPNGPLGTFSMLWFVIQKSYLRKMCICQRSLVIYHPFLMASDLSSLSSPYNFQQPKLISLRIL